jgi:hypothetical protein
MEYTSNHAEFITEPWSIIYVLIPCMASTNKTYHASEVQFSLFQEYNATYTRAIALGYFPCKNAVYSLSHPTAGILLS